MGIKCGTNFPVFDYLEFLQLAVFIMWLNRFSVLNTLNWAVDSRRDPIARAKHCKLDPVPTCCQDPSWGRTDFVGPRTRTKFGVTVFCVFGRLWNSTPAHSRENLCSTFIYLSTYILHRFSTCGPWTPRWVQPSIMSPSPFISFKNQ